MTLLLKMSGDSVHCNKQPLPIALIHLKLFFCLGTQLS